MGYIAPVTNYQYADYQKRVTAEKRDPIHIEKPFKVVLETQYEETYDSETKVRNEHRLESSEKRNPYTFGQYEPSYYNNAAVAAVTGKGQLFSGMV
ncbi:hypothetical protein QR721_04965 [Aciduricibacillus chroicocephali]|uniref:Uncharacterized protein n=1 Tax=Aciduricibacillus chroicocephali TaxID=3054939 RepID=A0ABY9KXP0_9BACI|nr:hypothetical protein QR721_04965 [Bacillaceae bacterium 44XB]